MRDLFTIELMRSAIRLTTPLLLATIASALCNRAGVLNLAIEGKMLLGAFAGAVGSYLLADAYGGATVALLFGAGLGAAFAMLARRFEIDLIILAIAINLLIGETTVYLMRSWYGVGGTWRDPAIKKLPEIDLFGLSNVPGVGDVLSGFNAIVYFSWLAAIGYWLLFKTKFGTHVRAVGEAPLAAEKAGIDNDRVRLIALVSAGALAGLAGAYLSIGNLALFTRYMSNGRGWIAITAALLATSRPLGVFFAALLFGGADAMSFQLQSTTDVPASLVQFFPVVAALVALSLVGARITYGSANPLAARRRRRSRPEPSPG